jgi:hypothetical protein
MRIRWRVYGAFCRQMGLRGSIPIDLIVKMDVADT